MASSGCSVAQTRQERERADTGGTSFVSLDTSVRAWHRDPYRGGLPRRHRAGPSASLDVERDESRTRKERISPRHSLGTGEALFRHTFPDSLTSGHRGCPWGWLTRLSRLAPED